MESFEVFSDLEVRNFILEHQEFIENNPDLFNPNYQTLKPRNKDVFKFIKCLIPNPPKEILKSVFEKYSKSLNRIRTQYKKDKRNDENKTEFPDLTGKYLKNIYQNYNWYLLVKVIKQTKCFVVFNTAKEVENFVDQSTIVHSIKIESDEIQWDNCQRKMKKDVFLKDILDKEVDLETAKTLKRTSYFG